MDSKNDDLYRKKAATDRVDGIHLSEINADELAYSGKADILIQSIRDHTNARGFIEGRISRLKVPTEKGVTHFMFAMIPANQG